MFYTSLKGVVSLFFKEGDPGGHKGKILGGKENSELTASRGNERGLLLFIPSVFLVIRKIFSQGPGRHEV